MLTQVGLVKTTLLDFPGRVAAILFTPGCDLRCPWCHNPGFVLPPFEADVRLTDALEILRKRRKVLGGVVVTGGEPLFHEDLPDLLQKLKGLGLAVKLDTNGTYPQRLQRLAGSASEPDYLAVDVKADLAHYGEVTGVSVRTDLIRQTLALTKQFWLGRSEFRLTWVPGLHTADQLPGIAELIQDGPPIYVTGFRSGKTLDPRWAHRRSATRDEVTAVVEDLVRLGADARLREV
ncbi:MAG: anaerobic ribonucleoside-triphosphate reductase activating protein [Spirochaetales bacterium]|nr:anaerobic ribonucleoside-triphosphate reductase activating protein [Spirochaetales bacterium]